LAVENLDIVAEQSRRINNLVRRLRDLTSFDAMTRTPVALADWMATWVASRRRENEAWAVRIEPVGEVGLVTLLWEQALDNLLANSREASSGTAPLALHLEVVRAGALISVSWSDSNVIAEGSLAQVGTARYTTKKDGSGLGVFFVRRIAELHGGGLVLERSPSGGLQSTLTLEGAGHGPHPRRR
jgi:signal transduction histidine kinase